MPALPAATPRLDVQALLNDHPFSAYQWRIFALCFVISPISDGAMKPIAEVSKPSSSTPSAALFGLAAGALLAGPLADRHGRKRVLVASVLWVASWRPG